MEVGQVGRLGPYLTAPVVQMLMNVDGSQGLDPAPVQHQRMEEMIVLVTAKEYSSFYIMMSSDSSRAWSDRSNGYSFGALCQCDNSVF